MTIANNSTPGGPGGGGLVNDSGAMAILQSILAHGTPHGAIEPNCSGAIGSGGYNLSDDSTCNFSSPGDLNNTGASLDPTGPQLNGGITPTIALLPGSLAVNRIPPGSCSTGQFDQRNVPRPQGSGCDSGAFELAAFDHFTAKLGLINGPLGRLNLTASFTLQSDLDTLDPTSAAPTLRIGTYHVSPPAGSFRSIGGGEWAFAGLVNGTGLSIQIQSLGGERYQLTAQGTPANFFGVTSPTTLSLTIGVYSGAITVPFTPAI